MTDEELETAVRTAFVRQARDAPLQGDLPERVRAASRRRERRERVLGVAVAAAAVVAVLAVGRVLPFGPIGDSPPGVAAVSPGSALVAADELVVCLVQESAGVTDLMLATRPGRGSTSSLDATVDRSSDGTLRLTYQEGAGRPVVRLELPSGSGGWQPVRDKRHVDVRGRDGWIGEDPALGRRVVSFDSGVEGLQLRLSVDAAAPDDAALVDLARRIVLSTDPDSCA